uniref:Tetratricopeptide repeat protein n=1 Tax=Strombidium inclinatum TaxID=197538 RepID=A0A7S3N2F2_9SPIT|mmetsp:Transcript_35878/g.55067  ORF Transcript_35878/g.55067 Transcript_35878/m.55067 type:complete len:138 (+) Transcript_35878:1096-1509(+)
MALNCFSRAIQLSDDSNLSEVYYNLGHVAISIGDLQLAYQCFKITISSNPNHAESFNNLGVLELRKGNVEQAKSNFMQASRISGFLFEPCYNAAYLMYKRGDFQESYTMALKSQELFPEHEDSRELITNLQKHFSIM